MREQIQHISRTYVSAIMSNSYFLWGDAQHSAVMSAMNAIIPYVRLT
jgi:hypothetical protein